MSSKKGGVFERKMAKDLSRWWSNGRDDSCFWRTAMSGGRATVRAKKGLKTRGHAGDLCSTDSFGQPLTRYCIIELKKGRQGDGTVQDLLDKKKGGTVYGGWIEKLEAACGTHGTPHWMIIHGRDRREPLVLFPIEAFRVLFRQKPMMRLFQNDKTLCLMRLQDFFDVVDPKDVKTDYRTWREKCHKAPKRKLRKT